MAQTRRTRRTVKKVGTPASTDWYETFLEQLRTVPNVSAACKVANIGRTAAYAARQRDETFALAWHDAVETGLDALERIAHARATAGQTTTKVVTKRDAEGNVVEETITEERHISDSLLMFMLKRYRPEFRESFRIENTGPDGGPMRHEVTVVDETVRDFYDELDRLRPVD